MAEQGASEQADDEPGPGADFGAVPSRDDRLWRHPAEVAAEARAKQLAEATPTDSPRRTTSYAVAAVAALGGGLLITGLWLAIGSTDTPPVGSTAGIRPESEAIATAVESPGPIESSTVEVRAVSGRSVGVGVAVTGPQELLTAADVGPADAIEVVLDDGSRDIAEVVGHDDLTGLTALRLTTAEVDVAAIPTAEQSQPGRGTTMKTLTRSDDWSHAVVEIDTDNAELGQPQLDQDGAVIGIVTDIVDGRAAYTPIGVAVRVARQLFTDGVASHPWLGIEGRDSAGAPGIDVTAVIPLGPARRSGLIAGERITGVGPMAVGSIAELLTLLRSHAPGETVVIEVMSGDSVRRLAVALAATGDA